MGNHQSEHGRLAHAAGLIEGVRDAIDMLSSPRAPRSAPCRVRFRLRPLTEYDAALREDHLLLESGEAQLRESPRTLRHYADRVELDPAQLREVEQRLEAAHGAARKLRVRPEGRCPSSSFP